VVYALGDWYSSSDGSVDTYVFEVYMMSLLGKHPICKLLGMTADAHTDGDTAPAADWPSEYTQSWQNPLQASA